MTRPERRKRLADAGTVTTLQGANLTITGEPTAALVIDEQERATVLCGNIPAANATISSSTRCSWRRRDEPAAPESDRS